MNGRTFIHPSRIPECTDIVYSGAHGSFDDLKQIVDDCCPQPHGYHIYWGEIHGHTELSDGTGSLDDYFTAARDVAKLDFCAVTDHDHGGVGYDELWGEKWQLTQDKVAEYHQEHRFVTILGYERDSWPWYSNLCLYYRNGRAEMVRGGKPGHISKQEMTELLDRDDVIAVPHHTPTVDQGVNFDAINLPLMTSLMEVYSKWGTSEFFGNPRPTTWAARGGFWQDALEKGAKMGCVAGSDIHSPHPGLVHQPTQMGHLIYDEPGLVAVLAKELTREAIFDALKARRCYASSGAKVKIDLRVNDSVMGQEIFVPRGEDRWVYFNVQSDDALAKVELIKNSREYIVHNVNGRKNESIQIINDLNIERETDYYYLRVVLQDGRQCWSSPIWINSK